MSDFVPLTNLILLLIALVLLQPYLCRWYQQLYKSWKASKQRQWKPASPHDCHLCCNRVSLQVIKQRDVMPYHQTKSSRGCKKSVSTHRFACPNPDCHYCGITDDTIHALVGYGHHNRIPRFKCQACGKVFTSALARHFIISKPLPNGSK